MSASLKPVPAALHRGEKELPFVAYQEGVTFQLLQADVEAVLDAGLALEIYLAGWRDAGHPHPDAIGT